MPWSHASLTLAAQGCEAAETLEPGQTLRCLHPGSTPNLANLDKGELPMWNPVGDTGDGTLVLRDEVCQRCPARMLPENVVPVSTTVTKDHVRMDVLHERSDALVEAFNRFREAGHRPAVRRPRDRPQASSGRWLDLTPLTERQRFALEQAVALGYFEHGSGAGVSDLAEAMGCSRSTAHEHLQRGISRLLQESFPDASGPSA